MTGKKKFSPEMSVYDIMREWPQTISVIMHFRMQCIGCLLATFHDAIDAAEEHGIDVEDFLAELNRVIDEEPN